MTARRVIDRTPLSEEAVWDASTYTYKVDGPNNPDPVDVPEQERLDLDVPTVEPLPSTLSWADLGEDGELAIMQGHAEPELLIKAMVNEFGMDLGDYDIDCVTHAWYVITEHRPDCDEDLEDDEACSCDEFAWWATSATKDTTGAIPVTVWSV